MQYVTRRRMHVARAALARGARVGELARQRGHGSEAASAGAFERVIGVSPVAARRAER
jgi:methylphosphotriester-DNA--protein-cysteine methyltransferase